MKLVLFSAAAALLLPSLAAHSQTFPAKPLRIVVPTTQGVSVDLFPRLLAPKLSEGFGQSVIVENRPGGGGVPGADHVARSAPDGYTVLQGTTSQMISVVFLQKNVPYDPCRDFTPIAAAIEPVDIKAMNSPERSAASRRTRHSK